jgi:hypothetical protein
MIAADYTRDLPKSLMENALCNELVLENTLGLSNVRIVGDTEISR